MLDGNQPHGITSLRAPGATGHAAGRKELERFSITLFSRFKREKMKGVGKYAWPVWQEAWWPSVLFK